MQFYLSHKNYQLSVLKHVDCKLYSTVNLYHFSVQVNESDLIVKLNNDYNIKHRSVTIFK